MAVENNRSAINALIKCGGSPGRADTQMIAIEKEKEPALKREPFEHR